MSAEGRNEWASPIRVVRLPAAPLAHDDKPRRDDFASRSVRQLPLMNTDSTDKAAKKGFDRSVTARSKCSLVFVCNKTSMGGVGLAEGHRQRATRIGTSGDRVI